MEKVSGIIRQEFSMIICAPFNLPVLAHYPKKQKFLLTLAIEHKWAVSPADIFYALPLQLGNWKLINHKLPR